MSRALDNRYDKNVFCPFYRGTENGQVIRCEGPTKETSVRLSFMRRGQMGKYLEKYCYTKECRSCRIYEAADSKYEEEE